ncbi:hypothetical protein SRHO_G00249430 [Serrasalmus rhombeus]
MPLVLSEGTTYAAGTINSGTPVIPTDSKSSLTMLTTAQSTQTTTVFSVTPTMPSINQTDSTASGTSQASTLSDNTGTNGLVDTTALGTPMNMFSNAPIGTTSSFTEFHSTPSATLTSRSQDNEVTPVSNVTSISELSWNLPMHFTSQTGYISLTPPLSSSLGINPASPPNEHSEKIHTSSGNTYAEETVSPAFATSQTNVKETTNPTMDVLTATIKSTLQPLNMTSVLPKMTGPRTSALSDIPRMETTVLTASVETDVSTQMIASEDTSGAPVAPENLTVSVESRNTYSEQTTSETSISDLLSTSVLSMATAKNVDSLGFTSSVNTSLDTRLGSFPTNEQSTSALMNATLNPTLALDSASTNSTHSIPNTQDMVLAGQTTSLTSKNITEEFKGTHRSQTNENTDTTDLNTSPNPFSNSTEQKIQSTPDSLSRGSIVFFTENAEVPLFKAITFDHPVMHSETFMAKKFHNQTTK